MHVKLLAAGFFIVLSTLVSFGQENVNSPILYSITVKEKSGFIDSAGNIVIPPKYFIVSDFCEGMAAVGIKITNREGYYPRYGYIDTKGNYLIPPKYKYAGCFSEGLASATLDGTNRSGFINKKGEFVFFHNYENAENFSEGLAVVKRGEKYGFIDKTGKLAIPLTFDQAFSFSDGIAQVGIGTYPNERFGFIDTKGNYVIRPQFENIVGGFSGGLAPLSVGKYPNSKYGYIDKTGSFVIRPQFDYAGEFSDGLAVIVINEKYGFIDKTGKIVIQPKFDGAEAFKNGLAAVLIGLTWGFIDKTGEIVIPAKYEQVSAFIGGLAKVSDLDNEFYINQTGETVWSPSENVNSYGNLTDAELKTLVSQMIKDEAIDAECPDESGNPKRLINIDLVDLNKDGKPEFEITGKGCACQGARRCFIWLYAKTANGFKLLLDAGASDGITVLKTQNKGYFDVQSLLPSGNDFVLMTYTYNGNIYQEKKCEIIEQIGTNKGEPIFGRPKPCQ